MKPKITLSRIILCYCFLFCTEFIYGANAESRIAKKAIEMQQQQTSIIITSPFQLISKAGYENINEVVTEFLLMKPAASLDEIIQKQNDFIKVSIPSPDGNQTLNLLLYKENISPNGFNLLTNDGSTASASSQIVHYRGMIENDPSSVVSFSFSNEECMGLISSSAGNFVFGKVEKSDHTYMIYNDRNLIPTMNAECNTNTNIPQNQTEKYLPGSTTQTVKCVNWYWETDYDLFLNKGTSTAVNSYCQGIFNQVSTLYANDGISITLQSLFIWTTTDPYTGPGTGDYLTQFGNFRTSFSGDMAHLIGLQGGGGVAWVNQLCNNQVKYRMAYSGINSSYNNVPLYSWTVEVMAHEEGHLLGSSHTHDCVWNGNNTRIDGCGPAAGYPSGSCAAGPIPVKGTIMSYCHLVGGVGIDLSLGFGPQPTALMINRINNAACLIACGTPCPVPVQPNTISGSTTVCEGASITYSIASVANATSYTWTVPQGWTGTSTTTSITVVAGSTSGSIGVTANNNCGPGPVRTLTVTTTPLPTVPVSISISGGTAKVCPGATRNYSTPAASGFTFQWTVPTGAVINSGQGSSAISVSYTNNFIASGDVTVVKVNGCGSSSAKTFAMTRNLPAIPGALTGTATGLCGATGITYSVPSVGGITYAWTVPAGATITSGQGTNAITVNYPASAITGSIAVNGSNACGSGPQRIKTVKTIPAVPASISGASVVCPNSSGNAYSITAIPTAINYTWTAPVGGHVSDGVTTSVGRTLVTTATSVTVNFGTIPAGAVVSVKAANNCGFGAGKQLPVTAAVCRIGDQDLSSDDISIYPNPTEGNLGIQLMLEASGKLEIQLMDLTGKIVFQTTETCIEGINNFNYDFGKLEKGMYLMSIKSANRTYNKKIELL